VARFSFQDLKDLWVQAGGNPQYADMAAAVALAESGGDPNSTNVNQGGSAPGSLDKGLWQINNYYHPSQSTYDPLQNARGAVQISQNGTNWRGWCTAYSDGRCGGTFLGAGSPALRYLPSGSSTGTTPAPATLAAVPVPDPTNPASVFGTALAGWLKLLGIPTPEQVAGDLQTWVLQRVYWTVLILGGSGAILVGLILIIFGSRPVKKLTAAAAGVAGPAVVERRIIQGSAAQRAQARTAASQPPVFNIFTPEPAPASAAPSYVQPVSPRPAPPVLEPIPPRKPAYRPRHQLMVREGASGATFRSGAPKTKGTKRARMAVAGRDKPAPQRDVFTVDSLLTPNYQGRRRSGS
jgi:hypothetical protein